MVSDRRRVRKIVKIAKENSPKYLSNYIKYFQNKNWKIQIQFCIFQWSKLSNLTKQLANIKKFKNTLIKYNGRLLFSIRDPRGLKLLYQLRFNFNCFNEHKFSKIWKFVWVLCVGVCLVYICGFVLCYLPKLKRSMALAFSADFLYMFSMKNVPY